MKHLKSLIAYECTTSYKYIFIFYALQYSIIILITSILRISVDNFQGGGINCLELNTLINVGILGILGFKEDFKMLIQNGFTRKYIFIATLSLFCFTSGIMALVDTIVGNALHYFNESYCSLYSGIYGYGNLFINWLWLFLLYILICSLSYLIILVINKLGKNLSMYLGIIVGGIVLITVSLFRYVFPIEIINNISNFLMKAIGFMGNGTINYLFPVATLTISITILSIISFSILQRTELK